MSLPYNARFEYSINIGSNTCCKDYVQVEDKVDSQRADEYIFGLLGEETKNFVDCADSNIAVPFFSLGTKTARHSIGTWNTRDAWCTSNALFTRTLRVSF